MGKRHSAEITRSKRILYIKGGNQTLTNASRESRYEIRKEENMASGGKQLASCTIIDQNQKQHQTQVQGPNFFRQDS